MDCQNTRGMRNQLPWGYGYSTRVHAKITRHRKMPCDCLTRLAGDQATNAWGKGAPESACYRRRIRSFHTWAFLLLEYISIHFGTLTAKLQLKLPTGSVSVRFSSFRRKSESRERFTPVRLWTPAFTGVTDIDSILYQRKMTHYLSLDVALASRRLYRVAGILSG
jgi:hypothetical protein